MKAIRAILVPVDFSATAAGAFRYALRLADRLDARIDLLYCVPPTTDNPGYGTFVASMTATLEERARTDMATFFREGVTAVATELEQLPAVRTFISVGDLRLQLREHVSEEDCQLIIMGTNGREDGWDQLLGTNTTFTIGRAPCPVLIVPRGSEFRPLNRLCYAADLRHVDALRAGNLLRALRPFRPEIHFLNVRSPHAAPPEYDLQLLRELYQRPGSPVRAHFVSREGKDVSETLTEYAAENDCDLVVMHRPHRSWLSRLAGGSETRAAALRTDRPLLIVRPADLVVSQTRPNREAVG